MPFRPKEDSKGILPSLQRFAFLQPERAVGIAGHSPVAAWREADAAHLGAVGQTAALELLGEEAPAEDGEPALDGGIVELAAEGVTRQQVDLGGPEAVAQEMVEEEVVQVVGAYEVFSLLADVPLLVGGYELGADRCVDDVEQNGALGAEGFGGCDVVDEMADEGLGHSGIDAVHGHVVTVIGGPAEREFAEVAGANDECSGLVGHVHEQLCAFACLRVFVGSVVYAGVVAYVSEVLCDGGGYADFTLGDAELGHEADGVVVGAVGGAEAGHGDADDAVAGIAEFIEGLDADEQRQCGVESAADAENNALAAGVDEAACESGDLDIENLVAAGLHVAALGDERMGIDGPLELEGPAVGGGLAADEPGLLAVGMDSSNPCHDEGGVGTTVGAQPLNVDLGAAHLWLEAEAFGLGQQVAVFVDKGVTAIDDVLRALAEAAAGIDVAANGACALLGQQ